MQATTKVVTATAMPNRMQLPVTLYNDYILPGNQNDYDKIDDCYGKNEKRLELYSIELNSLSFDLFPNPSKGKVTLLLPKYSKNLSITVVDILGKEIVQRIVTDVQQIELDLHNQKGIFFVKVESSDGYSHIEKVLIQ